jgi:hypothetical protein
MAARDGELLISKLTDRGGYLGDAKRGRFTGIAVTNGTSTYQSEAKADAAQYGYVNGSNRVTVTVLKNQHGRTQLRKPTST